MDVFKNKAFKNLFTSGTFTQVNKKELIWKQLYIISTIVLSFLGFVRSIFFVKIFSFTELGIITVVLTGTLFIAFFQIGVINGGYRIVSLQNESAINKVTNVVFSYFLFIIIVLFLALMVGIFFINTDKAGIFFIVILLGVIQLVNNWVSNILIGNYDYFVLSISNFISSLTYLLNIAFAFYFGLPGAIIGMILQPTIFIGIVYLNKKSAFPTKLDFDLKYFKHILYYGFIPFLTGIFFLLQIQIERFSINLLGGAEFLGKMYLYFLLTYLWGLLPSVINNLYFPKSIQAFNSGNYNEFKRLFNGYMLIVFGYSVICFLGISILMPILVPLYIDKYTPYISLVLMAIPGLTFKILSDPFVLYFYSLNNQRPILLSDISSLSIYVIALIALFVVGKMNLYWMVMGADLYYFAKLLYLFSSFSMKKEKFSIKLV
jgi:O-antigen/teichoic acid export membrane protein